MPEELYSSDFIDICKTASIAKIIYDITIPANKIHKKEETKSVVLYDSGKEYDDQHCLVQNLSNTTMNMKVSAKIYWDINTNLNEEELSFYYSFGSLLYLFMSRARLNDVLLNIINRDLLTGLTSLDVIQRKYDSDIAASGKSNDYAFVFANIQNMKFYNKVYNSNTGDMVLAEFAKIIQGFCNKDEFVSRPGGDNFVFIIKKENIDNVINNLEDIILPPLEGLQDKHRHISTWRGISLDVPPVMPFNARLYQCSVAANLAKNMLHKKILFYTEEIEKNSVWAKKVVANFSECIRNEEFLPFYQPKVQIQTGKIIGLESLVRWKKDGAILPPNAFVGILESYDLIPVLDMYMFEKTCKDLRSWIDSGITPPRISSNLSRKNLFDKKLIDKLLAIINKYDIPVEYLEIEIIETTSLDESALLIQLTKELKAHGIRVSMDDFGTGYSSLSLLKDVDPDIVKIDKTFVDDCLKDKRTLILIKNMINLSKELDMEIIAEGVETVEQANFLKQHGCDNAQGYLYSKPVPYEAITPQLRTGKYNIPEN